MFFNGYVMIQHLWLELSALLVFIFILNRSKVFRQSVMHDNASLFGKLLMSIAFGMIGVFGTYWGIPVVNGMPDINAFGNTFNTYLGSTHIDGIANTRAVGVIVGGLIGGPVVGTVAGLIAGAHRILALATFSSVVSGGITLAQGIVAGMIHQQIKNKKEQWRYGMVVGLVLEALHMLFLYMLGDPADRAVRLVYAITPAMLITNSIGVAAFIGILEAGYREKERTEALAAKIALNIANKTMSFLRAGLNEQSAHEAANIIYQTVDQLGAVAITSRERVLAFVGASKIINDNHAITESIAQVLETGEYGVYQKKEDIGCSDNACPLASQVIVPLKDDGKVVGSLVLYRLSENSISLFETELACGLAKLISTQIEISKGERQAKLLASAEVKALQAQINPHFLFNALNTIGYYCRKQPETAKRLIFHLGNYYRSNLAGNDTFVTLRKEIQCVDDYVKIEMARFEGRLTVDYQIEPECDAVVPPLILQPLVENAIKHGINPKEDGGNIRIIGKHKDGIVELTVEDDGVGINPDLISKVLEYDPSRKSIGLSNVHSRLISIYGPDNGLRIESKENVGTRISLMIPQERRL
ncbi:hypothetical protein AXX12_00050 [Anaerosporomusa subterranea]|uniref:histidine kinase n=1 Tax=Anaerosporomusa subterranea TaxID=1794912 RepID=A0A154BVB8_ANASB|nr:LytS/YhcK type 5TM receptor domain-containing protein [Anaerosporomusa subterranea]KYZ77974.1 hypothetical protein AXX12_00050 [Anaerosporomusa subterranea]